MNPEEQSRRKFLKTATLLTGLTSALAGCPSNDPSTEDTPEQANGTESVRIATETTADGSQTPSQPAFDSIQEAVEAAQPGETVEVPPGTYNEHITTVRSGTASEPITITGPESAVIRGGPSEYGIVRINHSHIRFTGFTVEGLKESEAADQIASYIQGQLIQTRPELTTDEYLRDIVIAPDRIGYSRDSLIGLERTKNAEIGPLKVSGLAGADYIVGDDGGRNGELLYIGTSGSNLGSQWHPWTEFDETSDVYIHHIDNSDGHAHAEAVDIKEGTDNVTVEYLTDRNGGQVATDKTTAAVSFKSHNSTVRRCDIAGAPVAVEFHAGYPDLVYGNNLYYSRLHDCGVKPIVFRSPAVGPQQQGLICGNIISNTPGAEPFPLFQRRCGVGGGPAR